MLLAIMLVVLLIIQRKGITADEVCKTSRSFHQPVEMLEDEIDAKGLSLDHVRVLTDHVQIVEIQYNDLIQLHVKLIQFFVTSINR